MLGIVVVEVGDAEGNKGIFSGFEVDIYKNTAEIEEDVFYFFHEGKNNAGGNAKTFIFAPASQKQGL